MKTMEQVMHPPTSGVSTALVTLAIRGLGLEGMHGAKHGGKSCLCLRTNKELLLCSRAGSKHSWVLLRSPQKLEVLDNNIL